MTDGPLAPSTSLALLITQAADAGALASACAVQGIAVDAVRTGIGVVAVCRDASEDGPARAASAVSRVIPGVPLLLVRREGDVLAASRWTDGHPGEDIPVALVLSDAPEALEDLLLGEGTLADLGEVVSSAGMSRLRALRTLAASARAVRRARKAARGGSSG